MTIDQSKLFSKARKEAPADAEAVSHKLLARAGYIDQLGSGIFSLLPLGHRVNARIVAIIRQEMNKLGALEVTLPALQPSALWAESGRLETMDPPLFRTVDRHDKELVIASTHEEVVTDLARKNIESYKDLPVAIYQIQTKFRNEVRATGGLLRVREFQMKDLYSFHRTQAGLQAFYEKVRQAYQAIFSLCDLDARAVQADSGSIGGSISHEFSIVAPTGEDTILICSSCNFAANSETQTSAAMTCPECQSPLEAQSAIENGHIFQLGTKYSEAMKALFTDESGTKQPVYMGCYGIGIGRLLAAVVETHHDDRGIVWPQSLSPFDLHIIPVQKNMIEPARALARKLPSADILLDDREISAGQKFAEADLLGIATRVVMSEKTMAAQSVEVTARKSGEATIVPLTEFIARATR